MPLYAASTLVCVQFLVEMVDWNKSKEGSGVARVRWNLNTSTILALQTISTFCWHTFFFFFSQSSSVTVRSFGLLPHIVLFLSLFTIVGGGLSEGLCNTKGRRVHREDLVEVRMSLAPLDCTPKCRSQQHADEVVAALTGGSEGQLRAFLTSHCHNAATLRDAFGRTALHLAASLGKKALLEWLLEGKSADLMVKDKESGWTALHRSAFYGQIHCLISLVKVCA